MRPVVSAWILWALLSAGSADAKATFVTFDAYQVSGINATGTVTGWYDGANSFMRTTPDAFLFKQTNRFAPL